MIFNSLAYKQNFSNIVLQFYFLSSKSTVTSYFIIINMVFDYLSILTLTYISPNFNYENEFVNQVVR